MIVETQVGDVLALFALEGEVEAVAPVAEGHINRSWIVTLRAASAGASAPRPGRYLLQRINESVFPRPEHVMENIAHVTRHLSAAVRRALALTDAPATSMAASGRASRASACTATASFNAAVL